MKNNKEYIKKLEQEFQKSADKLQKETDSYIISFICEKTGVKLSSNLSQILSIKLVLSSIASTSLLSTVQNFQLMEICESANLEESKHDNK